MDMDTLPGVSDAARILEDAEARLRPLQSRRRNSWWEANVSATEENERRRVEAELALSDALADAELYRDVEAARADGAEGLDRRQLDVLRDSLVAHQVPEALRHRIVELEASVEARFAQHRGVVRGEALDDNQIKEILRASEDVAERREAWEASKTIGAAVADDVRELARLRNEAARSLGYRDWFALAVATSEMDEAGCSPPSTSATPSPPSRSRHWKAATDARLAERFGCGVSELAPWHYEDPFFQEVPAAGGVDLTHVFGEADVVALARETFDGIGPRDGGDPRAERPLSP